VPNVAKFSRVLMALHDLGLLKDDACKEPVTLFIRKATEQRHWHTTAHFRSKAAAAFIRRENPATAAAYQRLCVSKLRHEHVVPNAAVYRLICEEPNITLDFIEGTLRRYGVRATITREEDATLPRHRMPDGFFQAGHALYRSPLARYTAAGLADSLEALTGPSWFSHEV